MYKFNDTFNIRINDFIEIINTPSSSGKTTELSYTLYFKNGETTSKSKRFRNEDRWKEAYAMLRKVASKSTKRAKVNNYTIGCNVVVTEDSTAYVVYYVNYKTGISRTKSYTDKAAANAAVKQIIKVARKEVK